MPNIEENSGQVHPCPEITEEDIRAEGLRSLIEAIEFKYDPPDHKKLAKLVQSQIPHRTRRDDVVFGVYMLQAELLQWAKAELAKAESAGKLNYTT